MRYQVLILANALVLCARTAIKDNIYQIQGVFVDDGQQQLQQQQPQLLNLAANGFAPNALQLPGVQSQLAPKSNAPAGKDGSSYRTGPKRKSTHYAYPPRMPLPLPQCFHNPTGYVCCNEELNDLMVDTWTTLEQRPKFQPCNVNLIATHIQLNAQRHFNTSFETIVAYDDFAQKINFRGDMVCKVELGNRFILAYATATDAYNHDLAGRGIPSEDD
ncbi:hypothetical protein PRIPAC_90577 [Pristionchus pacificus]|uniref:Grd-9 n=1 Tax=Pristionchus pacificus TaxID=54126 RepID=A0A2A6CWS0_PRIPA|nr:hypothetical protein PRIPAC_90577 [Pristionchus pacificus]|eukprot:PDM82497.1 grd-9 [Pristionchus pacificus]